MEEADLAYEFYPKNILDVIHESLCWSPLYTLATGISRVRTLATGLSRVGIQRIKFI